MSEKMLGRGRLRDVMRDDDNINKCSDLWSSESVCLGLGEGAAG